jgi:hypothetical protein
LWDAYQKKRRAAATFERRKKFMTYYKYRRFLIPQAAGLRYDFLAPARTTARLICWRLVVGSLFG